MQHKREFVQLIWALLIFGNVSARIHKLDIRNDTIRYVPLMTFGFYKGGYLNVNLTNFKVDPLNENAVYGFSLDRTLGAIPNPKLISQQETCILQGNSSPEWELDLQEGDAAIYFTMDLKNLMLRINCNGNVGSVRIFKESSESTFSRKKRDSVSASFSDSELFTRKRRDIAADEADPLVDYENGKVVVDSDVDACSRIELPMTVETVKGQKYFNASFSMRIFNEDGEGLYSLYFHSCPNYRWYTQVAIDFTMEIAEENNGNFLSAAEMPLPALYFIMANLLVLSGCFWAIMLKRSEYPVLKIHYLMAAVTFLKSLLLLFYGVYYYFIQTNGELGTVSIILYYTTRLLMDLVLFITIVLIGTGWDFSKKMIADKDKKLFMILIPLQILAGMAEMIIKEGDFDEKTWRDVYLILDLACCGLILFPVVWSIKHTRRSAHTDGKLAVNLEKLRLFRHFFVMIVCYIYCTRIISFLIKIIVSFQYEWFGVMFQEIMTYVFFVITGYKFRPNAVNFDVANDDDNDRRYETGDKTILVSGSSGMAEDLGETKVTENVQPTTSE